ncbi:MAG: bifunctional riboflavin kinase/FAD synthetase [Tepidanaerobacteraceae bacterium]|jgi:riboflavin kinase/FMN adenylyltransferase
MKTYYDLSHLEMLNYTVCGLGNFDGVHLGHQKLINKLLCCSKKESIDSLIFTFNPHPSKILYPNKSDSLILTPKQKEKIIQSYGIDHLVFAPFTRQFSQIDYKSFIYDILIKKCRAKIVVVGFNYTFGFKGEGNAKGLKEVCSKEGIKTVIIPPVTYKGELPSSSYIRKLIQNGNVRKASDFMGRPFTIEGIVVHGEGLGKKMGFPTANISFEQDIILPACGVYAVFVSWQGNLYKGIANLGIKPTFGGNEIKLEVHLFDFDNNLYGHELEIHFIDNLRSEVKFHTAEDLIRQVQKDFTRAKKIL